MRTPGISQIIQNVCRPCPHYHQVDRQPLLCTADGGKLLQHVARRTCPKGLVQSYLARPTFPLPVLASPELVAARNAVCVGPPRCEHASHVEDGRVRYCDKCGCGSMQARIALQDWHCPIRKC